jgi:hypothetical protein
MKPQTSIAMSQRGLALTNLNESMEFAQILIESGLAPQHFDTPAKLVVAFQYGAELGLPAMSAARSIAVIRGRPCVWGDALPGLMYSTGMVRHFREYFISKDTPADVLDRLRPFANLTGHADDVGAVCEIGRTNNRDDDQITVFTVRDAKRAKLWGKPGPWTDYPRRMLQMRARGWRIRDSFPDVLCGLAVAEEVQDYVDTLPAEVEATATRLVLTSNTDTLSSDDDAKPVEETPCEVVDPNDYGGNVPPADVEPMPSELPFEARL